MDLSTQFSGIVVGSKFVCSGVEVHQQGENLIDWRPQGAGEQHQANEYGHGRRGSITEPEGGEERGGVLDVGEE